MSRKNIILFSLSLLIFLSCDRDSEEIILDPQTNSLVEALDLELSPLTINPLNWSDNELGFLDPIATKKVIALGEATHGTAEFFNAKHRIFKYLVENHNFKIFAFEADFGESLLINDAVQRGASNEIEELMKTKMHFWTWRTEEVKNLLVWMCEYNLDKSEEEKVQYMGVDCQFNSYHPGMLKDYLEITGAPFFSSAEVILNEAEMATEAGFDSYSMEAFANYLQRIDALRDSIANHENELIEVSSEKEYELNVRILEVIRQVSEVRYTQDDYSIGYRDQYMAENTAWLNEYFDGKKIVLWAHNAHIANDPNFGGGSMGYHLTQDFGNDYTTLGFLFSRGSFTAVGLEGEQYTELGEQEINVNPKTNSLNFVMSQSKEPVFALKIADLQKYNEWNDAFTNGMEVFALGAVFNNNPKDYYYKFNPTFFDYIIYFDKSTASVLL